ncbi:hypothetical protein [Tistrella mobilis]
MEKQAGYEGRMILIAGVAIDAWSIVVADRSIRRTVRVVYGWTGACGHTH